MAEVIILSDVLGIAGVPESRYMGPYIIASNLERAGFDAVVIDYFTRIPDFFSYLQKFLSSKTLLVGISTTFLTRELEHFDFVGRHSGDHLYYSPALWHDSPESLETWLLTLRELVNKYNSKAKIVFGGAKAAFPGMNHKGVDYFAFSMADQSVVDFAKFLREQVEPRHIIINDQKVIDNTELLKQKQAPQMQFSRKFAVQPGEALPMEISRGCIFNCKFCYYDKKESVRKDIALLRDEFVRNYDLFGTTIYHFCDDCFNDSRVKVEQICNMILSLPFKVEWVSYARVDVAVRFPETMKLMVESGACGLFMGLESLEPEVARRAGKGTPTDKVKEFLITFREKFWHKCLLECSLITGLPGETEQSLSRAQGWILENDPMDFLNIGPLVLAPYNKKLDKLTLDYPDYSRNPEKYGFKTISFHPVKWEHETMDSEVAFELAEEFLKNWRQVKPPTFLQTIWRYPILRTLGFSKETVFSMARDPKQAVHWHTTAHSRFRQYLQKYWFDLQAGNARQSSVAGSPTFDGFPL